MSPPTKGISQLTFAQRLGCRVGFPNDNPLVRSVEPIDYLICLAQGYPVLLTDRRSLSSVDPSEGCELGVEPHHRRYIAYCDFGSSDPAEDGNGVLRMNSSRKLLNFFSNWVICVPDRDSEFSLLSIHVSDS